MLSNNGGCWAWRKRSTWTSSCLPLKASSHRLQGSEDGEGEGAHASRGVHCRGTKARSSRLDVLTRLMRSQGRCCSWPPMTRQISKRPKLSSTMALPDTVRCSHLSEVLESEHLRRGDLNMTYHR